MKRQYLIKVYWVGFLLALAACTPGMVQDTSQPTAPPIIQPTSPPKPEPTATTAELNENLHYITILYTSDEHGYMTGEDEGVGAADMFGMWQDEFDYTLDGPFLVLSGGDMWTGSAISTWFNGASMIQVMNAMGYDAAVVGNHEFDFGLNDLTYNIGEMSFPLLSANTRYKSNGSIPTDIGIQAYALVEVEEILVGVIGLSGVDTSANTMPDVVESFDFIDYEEALREIVPEVREAGAEIIVVPTHICMDELISLVNAVSDLEITMFGSGHCHDLFSRQVDEAVMLGGGEHFLDFAFAEISYDADTSVITVTDYGTMDIQAGNENEEIAELVDEWIAEADIVLKQVIGYSENSITRGSREMNQLVAGSWLWSFPDADVALTNTGGIRTDIPEGEITIGNIITLMPFDNSIVELHLSGEHLENTLNIRDDLAYAGVKFMSGKWILTATGEEIKPGAIYVVLVNSFMYAGGSGFRLQDYDPDGFDTTVPYRQPLIDWIIAQGSSAETPIDPAINEFLDN